MSTVVIDLANGKCSLRGESMQVAGTTWEDAAAGEGEEEGAPVINRSIPLRQVSHVMVCPQVTLSGALIQELLLRGAGVTFMGRTGPLGVLEPGFPAKGALRLEQYRRSCEEEWCMRQARVIVATKIFNQAFMLRRRQAPPADAFFKSMKSLQKETLQACSAQELMGVEGRAAALYFPEWARGLPPAFPFTGRTRRPPQDPVNACLSYLAALCHGDMLCAILESGLDPDLGVLHSIEDYRHNLALDLMEPYRPILVEGVTRDILTHGMLGEDGTEIHEEDGGCYLSHTGRVVVIRRYRQRMDTSFTHQGKPCTLRDCMRETARSWKNAVTSPAETASNFKLSS